MGLTLYRPNEALAAKSTFEILPMALELANKLAQTEFVPVALRNKPAAIAAAMLAGHEVGLPPMASLQHVHVIEGRPSLSAAAQRALIIAHGHQIWIEEQTMTRAVVCGRRAGEERVITVVWTLDDAKRAQLAGKPMWQKYPRNMLVARATGDVARGAFMDVLGGIPYNFEELGDGVIEGELVEGVLVGEGTQTENAAPPPAKRRARRAATEPAEKPEPPPPPPVEPGGGEEPQDDGSEPPPIEATLEPPPADEQPQEPAAPPPTSEPLAGEKQPGEHLTLAQQVAVICRELDIERANLLFAVTGKTSGKEITRPQAVEVLEAAKAIQRSEKRLVDIDGSWVLADVVEGDREPLAGEQDDWS